MSKPNRQVLLAGATGLVGGAVLGSMLADRGWPGRVLAPVRRLPDVKDSRLHAITADLAQASADAELLQQCKTALAGSPLDSFICCIGTTLKTAGSREAFIAVDRELVLRLARIARELGAHQAILVSSIGASRQSGNFYLRVKGEVEDAVEKMHFDRLDVLQPGLLLGLRRERRPAEALAQALAPISNMLMIGKLRRYRAIAAQDVAWAIVHLLGRNEPGQFIHQHKAILALSHG